MTELADAGDGAELRVGGPARLADELRRTLETERDFLLRSLDDLEVARTVGEVEDANFDRLRDDYTARAAAAIRSLDEGRDRRPPTAPASSWRRRAAVGGLAAVFAAGAGLLVNASLGQRLPGQTVTGNAQNVSGLSSMEARVRDHPADPAAHRALAQARLDRRDLVDALKEFDAAARLDPHDAASRAYGGWIVYQAGVVDDALRRLDAAVAADPDYPDAHLFRGVVLFRAKHDAPAAVAELERYLAAVPNGPLDQQVRAVLDEARRAAAGSSSTTTP